MMEPNSRCVILVPVHSAIELECEQSLDVLDRRGYQVRKWPGSAIDYSRSAMASLALLDGFDELMWIDADTGFHPNDVDKLRSHGLPFCCGLNVKRGGRELAYNVLPGTESFTIGKGGGIREILGTGFSFVHTRRELYERIRTAHSLPECKPQIGSGPSVIPFFIPQVASDGVNSYYLTEDASFCYRMRQCGLKVMADTSILLSHFGKHPFSWKDFLSHQVTGVKVEAKSD
jgi:hypothetical protein